ncbi:enoyl-CoA hydratase/isomerase family protein [Nocardioides marmoribigeumensis]|uniref:enoyl-CoA hydratase/isomerase family protein n=1 Tax=Nocardioides marmoribigeumensis TaxID=433649 RepID=UPI00286A3775|nr:enoyl-CoA hydratase/isomerase family protein [Nocardioides marmoribigeumensis]
MADHGAAGISPDPAEDPAFALAAIAEDGVPSRPLTVVDLDAVDGPGSWFAGAGATLGRATRPLSGSAREVARTLTTSVVPPGLADEPTLVAVDDVDATVAAIVARTSLAPRTTIALDGLLRLTEGVDAETGVVAESFAYSMLLASPEFAAWRASRAPRQRTTTADPVQLRREGDRLDVVLDRPARGNAFSADLRQALVEALRFAALDPSLTLVRLSGEGRHFSTGGDLDEFGTAPDPGAAHAVRLDQSAGLAVHRIRDRVEARVHGRCIGAGIEVPAFAGRLVAAPGTTFQLPELELGLVPGAGGTVSIPARIGRWRTAYLVLTGVALGAATARDWGLVDAVE